MGTIIIALLVFYGLYRIIRAIAIYAYAAKAAKIEAEERRKAEMLALQKRQLVVEREQTRLAREQERQAQQLTKHDAEIERLKHTVKQATSDIDFLHQRIADLDAQLDYALLQQSGTVPGGKEHDKWQRKIITLHNQIHSAESGLSKAEWNKQNAEKKLA